MNGLHLAVPLLGLVCASAAVGCGVAPARGGDDNSNAGALGDVSPELEAAARANLARVAKEIDVDHLDNYRLSGEVADQFVQAVKLEYGATPALLVSRMKTLASMVFFSAPEVTTDPSIGHVTPFHGMDDTAFNALMANEDTVFNQHLGMNGGSPKGVRPFSVCETKFLIAISKGENTDASYVSNRQITSYDAYAHAFKSYADQQCSSDDLAYWYNFRGLGGLRPSWLESNLSDRFLRHMLTACRNPAPADAAACQAFSDDRLGYRDRKNTEFALREVVYDPRPSATIAGQPMSSYMISPYNAGTFVDDRNSDGVAEWLAPGPVDTVDGATVTLNGYVLQSDLQLAFGAKGQVIAGGAVRAVATNDVVTVKAGSTISASHVTLPAPGGTLVVDSSASARALPGAQLVLADGTSAYVPQNGEMGVKQSSMPIKMTTSISRPLSTSQPTLALSAPGGTGATQFTGELDLTLAFADGGTVQAAIGSGGVKPYDAVDPSWKKEYATQPDLGLLTMFKDGSGCSGSTGSPSTCPLLQRFYSVIDRHEYFYNTYSSLDPTSASISQQPSPLVACSITLAASHQWDTAGTPPGGTAGFIYLMRIPFAQILTADDRSIDTLGLLQNNSLTAGPAVLRLKDVYAGKATLDMSKVWLDIATLSNDQYQTEHEVSKYGSVPAEQIEGMLVVRRPAAMP